MTTKKHIFSVIALGVFALLFWASKTQKPIVPVSSSNVLYEETDRNTTPTPYEITYELPALKAVEQTKQDQVKGGVTVSCEVTPFEAVKTMYEEKEIVTADPNKPGYDIFKVHAKARYEVKPDDVWFNIRIKNNQDRILKLKDVAIVILVDGVAYNIPDEAKQEWVGGMLVKGFEKTQKIKGPKISGLATDKIVYVSINDVPTAYNAAGEVTKKENFEWYYQVTREKVKKQEMIEYSYQEAPVYKETCNKCAGSGTVPEKIDCSKCYGTGKLQYTDLTTGKKWIGNCDKCSGSGKEIIQLSCGVCGGKGRIEYPKSPAPKVVSNITWTGWEVAIITNPKGSTINIRVVVL
ncbi:MAG: hypothetical protein OHK0019_38860 [Saprospiraceae bacterium]